jgi:2-iminobutanoate/2-iminopropanoate deaminase
MSKEYFSGEQQSSRSYSKVVKTEGGKTLYLAGVGGSHDADGNVLDFAGQTRLAFSRLDANLREAGGTLADMTTMTVFVTDVRFGDQFTQIRKEFFEEGKYPGSALITVTGLARPEMHVEIQGIAVIAQ